MYGLVNVAIKDLVIKLYDEDAWKEVCKLSNFEDEDFVGMESYPDNLTYTLVANVCKVSGLDSETVLKAFGEHWILFTADQGYGDLMNLSGSDFVSFLNNLDMLHERIGGIMPELSPPQFTTRNATENSVELEYRSHRAGLLPMLYGLVYGLGKRFDISVTISQIEFKSEGAECDVLLITW
jgi:hypothetical protein